MNSGNIPVSSKSQSMPTSMGQSTQSNNGCYGGNEIQKPNRICRDFAQGYCRRKYCRVKLKNKKSFFIQSNLKKLKELRFYFSIHMWFLPIWWYFAMIFKIRDVRASIASKCFVIFDVSKNHCTHTHQKYLILDSCITHLKRKSTTENSTNFQ